MDIIEATRQALEQNVGIRNNSLKNIDCYLLPTNTDVCFMVVPNGYSHKSQRKTADRFRR